MFESLQDNLAAALKSLAGKARLTEANMREGLAAVQQSLLEADVSYSVVTEFMQRVASQAVGERVLKSLNQPAGFRHRLPGARQFDGPGRPLAALEARGDGADDVRLAGLGQDDDLRQAGPHD